LVELDELASLGQLLAEAGVFLPSQFELSQSLSARGTRELGVSKILLDLVGVVVSGLAGAVSLTCCLRDSAVRAKENSSGIGDAAEQRYFEHGSDSTKRGQLALDTFSLSRSLFICQPPRRPKRPLPRRCLKQAVQKRRRQGIF